MVDVKDRVDLYLPVVAVVALRNPADDGGGSAAETRQMLCSHDNDRGKHHGSEHDAD